MNIKTKGWLFLFLMLLGFAVMFIGVAYFYPPTDKVLSWVGVVFFILGIVGVRSIFTKGINDIRVSKK